MPSLTKNQTKTLSVQFSRNEIDDDYDYVKEESNSWTLSVKKSYLISKNDKKWPEFNVTLKYKPKEDRNSVIAAVKLTVSSSIKRGAFRHKIATIDKTLLFDHSEFNHWTCAFSKIYLDREDKQKELKPSEICIIEASITLTTIGNIPFSFMEYGLLKDRYYTLLGEISNLSAQKTRISLGTLESKTFRIDLNNLQERFDRHNPIVFRFFSSTKVITGLPFCVHIYVLKITTQKLQDSRTHNSYKFVIQVNCGRNSLIPFYKVRGRFEAMLTSPMNPRSYLFKETMLADSNTEQIDVTNTAVCDVFEQMQPNSSWSDISPPKIPRTEGKSAILMWKETARDGSPFQSDGNLRIEVKVDVSEASGCMLELPDEVVPLRNGYEFEPRRRGLPNITKALQDYCQTPFNEIKSDEAESIIRDNIRVLEKVLEKLKEEAQSTSSDNVWSPSMLKLAQGEPSNLPMWTRYDREEERLVETHGRTTQFFEGISSQGPGTSRPVVEPDQKSTSDQNKYENTINELRESIENQSKELVVKTRQLEDMQRAWETKCREKVEMEISLNEYKKALECAQEQLVRRTSPGNYLQVPTTSVNDEYESTSQEIPSGRKRKSMSIRDTTKVPRPHK